MYVKNDLDSNTIGIILCPEANGFVCKTTLINTKNIAISKYKFMDELPEYLERKLKEVKKSNTIMILLLVDIYFSTLDKRQILSTICCYSGFFR